MLLDNIMKEQAIKLTENGAVALDDSGNALVNLFAKVGAMRERSEFDIENAFVKAMAEDKLLGTKMAFYARDVRGGLGERRTGRIMLSTLAKDYPDILRKNLSNIVEFGRWDDLIELLGTGLQDDAVALIDKQLNEDVANMKEGEPISLLAKWLPSVNTSSVETRNKGRKIAELLGLSEKAYRKTLSSLRAYLNVTEVRMTEKNYDSIRYNEVPSVAMNRYHGAFIRNDGDRFKAYINDVKEGKTKINSSVLYPYDVVGPICDSVFGWGYHPEVNYDVLEEQWKALPNYVEGEKKFLIMADVSGSMAGRPIATSVGLAMYFAERNTGAFANKFMTFSARPKLVEIKGDNIKEKVKSIIDSHWDMNTNLEAAFRLVLDTAVKHNSPQNDLPDSIVIISDMEIDACTSIKRDVFYDAMKAEFEKHGYKIPNIVFWNVNARHDTFLASADASYVQLVSGQSATTFKNLCSGVNPYEFMVKVLSDKRYDCITV